ncbi:MAG: hypothetical protein RL264_2247 [Bacteroidota bacterium]|jgi:CBS domain containing-hemolysin-like protein
MISLVFLSLLLSAFFSGMELAYISSNRLKIEVQIQKGNFTGKVLKMLYREEQMIIVLLLLGNNLSLVIYGVEMAKILEPMVRSVFHLNQGANGLVMVIQTLLSTILVLITAEFLPKAIVQINPNRFMNLGYLPLTIFYFLLYLPARLIFCFSNASLKLFGIHRQKNDKVFTKVDLEHYVHDISSRLKNEEELGKELVFLRNALDFSNVKARDCMVPRAEIIAIDFDETIENIGKLFVETGLSKIIVFRDSIDNIIGYVHSYDLFKKPKSVKQVLKPISFVPSVISGKELMEKFTKQSSTLAVVTDEYGGTAGIVTLEDVIEEIFGEIEDEHDKEEWLEEQINENEYLFSGRIPVDDLIKNYNLTLTESEDYDTLGGMILHHMEKIPEQGENLRIGDYLFTMEEVSDRRIEKIRLTIS